MSKFSLYSRMLLPYVYTRARGNYSETFLLDFHLSCQRRQFGMSNELIRIQFSLYKNDCDISNVSPLSKGMAERVNGKKSPLYGDNINSCDERTEYRLFFPLGDSV